MKINDKLFFSIKMEVDRLSIFKYVIYFKIIYIDKIEESRNTPFVAKQNQ